MRKLVLALGMNELGSVGKINDQIAILSSATSSTPSDVEGSQREVFSGVDVLQAVAVLEGGCRNAVDGHFGNVHRRSCVESK